VGGVGSVVDWATTYMRSWPPSHKIRASCPQRAQPACESAPLCRVSSRPRSITRTVDGRQQSKSRAARDSPDGVIMAMQGSSRFGTPLNAARIGTAVQPFLAVGRREESDWTQTNAVRYCVGTCVIRCFVPSGIADNSGRWPLEARKRVGVAMRKAHGGAGRSSAGCTAATRPKGMAWRDTARLAGRGRTVWSIHPNAEDLEAHGGVGVLRPIL